MRVRLSLCYGRPWSQLAAELTSAEWSELIAADNLGLIPDFTLYRDLVKALSGQRDNGMDMATGARIRRGMYANHQ